MPRSAAKMTEEDDALLQELGVEVETKRAGSRTAREERIIAGFEEIQRFAGQHGRAPQHGEDRDIFERLYAVRLDRLRELSDCRVLLEPFDHGGLLAGAEPVLVGAPDELDDDELLAQLGVEGGAPIDITDLRHVRSAAEKRAAEEIANHQKCEDFEGFKPLFEQVQKELSAGLRQTRRFERKSEILPGRFYILGGHKAYVAAMEEPFTNEHGNIDARLRVIFDNGTESNLLMRSLQKALQQDAAGRRIIEPSAGPLFADQNEEGDEASGIVYVLRSKSEHPAVAANRDVLHKIGVTGGDVARRIANARLDPTFLMADVEIVATYELYNINRTRLEHLIHRIFDSARLDIEIKDRFGQPIVPREWFLVPHFVVDEVIDKIRDGTITGYVYDPKVAALTLSEASSGAQV
jgi:T5orf172 domain